MSEDVDCRISVLDTGRRCLIGMLHQDSVMEPSLETSPLYHFEYADSSGLWGFRKG